LRSIFLAHAAADAEFARDLSAFLEFGCDVTCCAGAGLMSPGHDLIDTAEEGMASDVVVLLLSPESCPVRWARNRWEPVLSDQAQDAGVQVVSILLGECPYPALLNRQNFFDATTDRKTAMRLFKRWIWQPDNRTQISPDLERLYAQLVDSAGAVVTAGADAERFAGEAKGDFEAVLWIPCYDRSLAQAAGELGAQLGMRLDGTAKKNCERIREFLYDRRCLVVLDAPSSHIRKALQMTGRTSNLTTTDVVRRPAAISPTVAQARELAGEGRFAEAYEMFYALLDDCVDTETCARELTWICEHWDRVPEANNLRVQYIRGAASQLSLF
jgi:hypothetical protein